MAQQFQFQTLGHYALDYPVREQKETIPSVVFHLKNLWLNIGKRSHALRQRMKGYCRNVVILLTMTVHARRHRVLNAEQLQTAAAD